MKSMKKEHKGPKIRINKHSDLGADIQVYHEKELYQILEGKKDPLLLVLDCVQDPHNLGACMRTADGAGVVAVIVPKDNSVTITDTVRRVACGGAENVPFVPVTNLARCLRELKKMNIWLVGTSDKAGKSLYEVDLKGGIAIVMGAEGKGLRRLTEEECDFLVTLPMQGQVPCLNVSVATGVCLYEAVRQRSLKATETN